MRKPFAALASGELRSLQLAVLDAFDRHCRGAGLRYYVWAGTLLGAMRHGGYIPWDDDIDIAMPRADYERFRREFPASALARRFALHHLATDPGYVQPIMKLGDLQAVVLDGTSGPSGVGIDLFPLDAWPAGRIGSAAAWLGLAVLFQLRWLSFPRTAQPGWGRARRALLAAMNAWQARLTTRVANGWIDAYLRRLRGGGVTVGAYFLGPLKKLPRAAYGDPAYVRFEGRMLPAPAEADAVLTHLYGEWRVPPPAVARRGHPWSHVVWLDAATAAALRVTTGAGRSDLRDLASLRAWAASLPPHASCAPEAVAPAAAGLG
jgi:lipopolysaccharide cholinephosphotransferase